jgi:hypothetical protein
VAVAAALGALVVAVTARRNQAARRTEEEKA